MSQVATLSEQVIDDFATADEPRYEVIDGQKVEKPLMGSFQILLGSILHGELRAFAKQHRLGRAVTEMLFNLDPRGKTMYCPDVAFVSYERWPRERKIDSGRGWDVVPELAIEVNSPTNKASEVLKKIRAYFQSGVLQVWVVFPEVRQVYVYESSTKVQILALADALDGGELLPGFGLTLAELFEDGAEDS